MSLSVPETVTGIGNDYIQRAQRSGWYGTEMFPVYAESPKTINIWEAEI